MIDGYRQLKVRHGKLSSQSNLGESSSLNVKNPINHVEPHDNELNTYDPPEIIKQPKRYRRVRVLSEVADKNCSFVQAGEGNEQRKYMVTGVITSMS